MNYELMAHEIKAAAFERTADGFEVTAWGDAERKRIPGAADWDDTYDLQWRTTRTIKVHQREADNANLRKVFDEARRIGAVIVWRDNLPKNMVPAHRTLRILRERMMEAWGELPPYIEIDDYGWYVYSIKPIWELAA